MPTYEYACTECGHHLEVSQSFTDASLETCPNCGGRLRKVFGAIGIVLKGSGFYKTDSRASASKAASRNGTDKSSASSSSASGEPSTSTSSSGSGSTSTSESSSTSPASSPKSPTKAATA